MRPIGKEVVALGRIRFDEDTSRENLRFVPSHEAACEGTNVFTSRIVYGIVYDIALRGI